MWERRKVRGKDGRVRSKNEKGWLLPSCGENLVVDIPLKAFGRDITDSRVEMHLGEIILSIRNAISENTYSCYSKRRNIDNRTTVMQEGMTMDMEEDIMELHQLDHQKKTVVVVLTSFEDRTW